MLEVAEEDEVSEDSREYAQTTVKNAVEFATEKCKVRPSSSSSRSLVFSLELNSIIFLLPPPHLLLSSIPSKLNLPSSILCIFFLQVDKERVFFKALEPEGGASDISLSIKHYQEANGIDVVVVGSRGMGAVKRALFSLVGLGSVSDWCAHNMSCPVIVIKGAEEPAVAKD